jgi:HopA1 effector protein family
MLQLPVKTTNLFNELDLSLQSILYDISHNITIGSSFSIQHPDYKPFDLPKRIADRLIHLPLNIRNENISRLLCSFLYGVYYNSSAKNSLSIDNGRERDVAVAEDLENSSYLGMDVDFYEKLHHNNAGNGYYDSGWVVQGRSAQNKLTVRKNGLTLLIETEKHLHASERSCLVGDSVSILMPKNLMQNAFYMAICDRGVNHRNFSKDEKQTVRIYFNASADGSPCLMNYLTSGLNASSIEFTYKTLYNPNEYGRYDSGVLYIQRSDYGAVHSLLQEIYARIAPYLFPETPLFTKRLAPGIGLAEEPVQNLNEQESFGSHRCRILADGFLKSWQSNQDSPQNRLEEILRNFSLMQIDLQQPYLNAKSSDVYAEI